MTKNLIKVTTLVELLCQRARNQPDKVAYTFLVDGESDEISLTYAQLEQQVRAIASQLQRVAAVGERALLLYPAGLDFIAAFFGCLYAGVVAVPAYPPRRNHHDLRFQAIANDAQATIVLTTTEILFDINSRLTEVPELQSLHWLTTNNLASEEVAWQMPDIHGDSLAFLQYTSGSTGTPKGVMVSHGNLLHNEEMIRLGFGHTESTIVVGWLPLFHDMGLIGNVLQPLYLGFPVVLMSPLAFLQKPFRWLQAISHYQATTSGGPNFAYNLCVQKITPDQRAKLDLSSWALAFSGAEPVRAETLDRFTETFEACGFRREAFYPCYGMAETTLFISGGLKTAPPAIYEVDKASVELNRVMATFTGESTHKIVGCGQTWLDQKIVIVEPKTFLPCPDQQIGEIWISGENVTLGYWKRPEETQQTFHAHLANTDEGPFLRTGDLGFLKDGELFVTGRLKDLIIIRGRNYYPQDIELTVEKSHQALNAGGGAAFSVTSAGEERLVIAQEVQRAYLHKLDVDEVVNAIRETVFEQYELLVDAVLLLKTASIPKTSSGKIQRHACRKQFLAGELKIVGEWRQSLVKTKAHGDMIQHYVAPRTPTEEKLAAIWADVLGVEKVGIEDDFFDSGGHSLLATQFMSRLRDTFSIELSLRYLFESPTVASLAKTIENSRFEQSSAPPIQVIERTDKLPLSFAQERMWFLSQLEGGNAAYNIPGAVRLTGSLSMITLEQSLNEIVQRHETLRTIFKSVNGTPVVQVLDFHYQLPVIDLQDLPLEEQNTKVQQLASTQAQIPFKLNQVPLFRFFMIQKAAQEHILLLIIHHIIADGWSMGIFTQELTRLYQAFAKGKPSPLPALPIQYVDFAHWQRQWLSREVLKTQLEYWQPQLAEVQPLLDIPTDRNRPAVQSFRGSTESFAISVAMKQKLNALSQQSKTTLFMVLLAAFVILLYRYSEKEDIVVGSPIANRNRTEIEGLIGFFANTLALRIDLSGNPTFMELLERVRKVTMAAYAHQDAPFEKLVETLQPERNLSYNPLVQVIFALRNTPVVTMDVAELSVTPLTLNYETGIFDLFMELVEIEDGFSGTLVYSTDLFDAITITRLIGYFQTLLNNILANPQQRVAELPLLTENELTQITSQLTPVAELSYPNQCLHQWFEAQVEKTPNAVAIISDNTSLSYRELNTRSNQLARQLRAMGVGPNICVGIYMAPALEMVVGLLGILKAGGAFLPLTPEYPEAFVTRMLTESQAPVLLSHLLERLPKLSQIQTICFSKDWQTIAPQKTTNLDNEVTLDNLAYVIYASTQSIQITHQAIAQRLAWLQKTLTLSESDIILQKTPLDQDTALWEVFAPLVTGGRVVLATLMDNLPHLIATHQVSLLHLLPSELPAFVETLKLETPLNSLRGVLCSGEPLQQTLVDAFFQSEKMAHCGLQYFYRLPEAAGEIMLQHCQPGETQEMVPLGRPTYRTIGILDSQLQPVPWGGKGEIYVENLLTSGECWLTTGELGHLLNDGTIARLGSRHQYAWIDGFRVDLTVIEATLLSEPSVDECWVLARETKIFHYKLVAYVVLSGRFSPERLSAHLQTQLPAYMLPYAYVPLSSLPLTAEGDVDEPALARLAVIETEVIQQWEQELRAFPQIKRVAVLAQETVKKPSPLHLSDLLADWKTLTINEVHHSEVSVPTPLENRKDESKPKQLAISHGQPLRKTTDAAVTLADTLRLAASRQPSHGISYILSDNTTIFQTYGDLLEEAQRILAGFRKVGLKPQDKVIFQLDSNPDFISAFWGCVLGGFVPVPIGVAPSYEQINNTVSKLGHAWQLLDHPIILTNAKLASSVRSLSTRLNLTSLQVEVIEELKGCDPDQNWHESQATDLALLLLTSGSTGMPKAVMQSHHSLLSRCAGTVQMNGFSSQDVSLNWMPLDHVGGIVFFHLRDIYLGNQQIHAPTKNILQEPLKWLDWIDDYKATITWAPNFAFALINDALSKNHCTRQWDLSSMRFIFNGGESIVAQTARTFMALLTPYGLPVTAMHPAWGMSETSSGVTYSYRFSLDTTTDNDRFVEVGAPIPGFSMRIVDEQGQVVNEKMIGYLQVKGLSVTSGYFKKPELNREIFTQDDWFKTGDSGFLHEGCLTITGREKEVIIVNGINYYSHEIEKVVEAVEKVEVSYTAACAIREGGTNTDKLVIFFNSTESDDNRLELLEKIRLEVVQNIGISPNYLIPVEKAVIPKTAIGKIQRSQLVERFIAGEFGDILKRLDLLSENENTVPDWFYQKTWHKKAIHPNTLLPNYGQCLVFLDFVGLGRYLCEQLEHCIQVEPGSTFVRHNTYFYQILPSEAEHYQRLLSSLKNDGIHVSHILHFWTYEAYSGEISSVEALKQAQVFGIYSLLFLVQALTKTQYSECQLLVISSYAQATLTTDKIAYEKSTLIGLLKTIPLELSWLQCRHIDLEVGPSIEKNAAYVLTELSAFKGDSEVAYRDDKRLIPFITKMDMQTLKTQAPAIKLGGIYLITGGLGGIGTFLSQFLLEKFHAKLIIVGRTALPNRETWTSHLEQDTRLAKRLKSYLALEKVNCGEFIYQAVDVCELAALQQIIAEAENKWHDSISGIVHLAGELAGESTLTSHWQMAETQQIAVTTQSSFETMLRAKVYGSWTLYQLIKDNPTAIFLTFSSVNGLFGGASFSAYSSANSFLEGCTFYQQSHGHRNSYCLSWSLWDEIGMSHGSPISTRDASRAMGYQVISKERGLHSLLAALSRPPTHLIVGLDSSNPIIRQLMEKSINFQRLTAYITVNSNDLPLAQLQVSEVRDIFGTKCPCDFVQLQTMPLTDTGNIDKEKLVAMESRIVQGSKHIEPRTEVERQLVHIWQEVLDIPNVSIEDNFFALGGHSLLATQMISRVYEVFQIDLPVQTLFEKPSVAGLAEQIEAFRMTAQELQVLTDISEEDREEGFL